MPTATSSVLQILLNRLAEDLPDDNPPTNKVGIRLIRKAAVSFRPIEQPRKIAVVRIVHKVTSCLRIPAVAHGITLINEDRVVDTEACRKRGQISDEKSVAGL